MIMEARIQTLSEGQNVANCSFWSGEWTTVLFLQRSRLGLLLFLIMYFIKYRHECMAKSLFIDKTQQYSKYSKQWEHCNRIATYTKASVFEQQCDRWNSMLKIVKMHFGGKNLERQKTYLLDCKEDGGMWTWKSVGNRRMQANVFPRMNEWVNDGSQCIWWD